MNRAESQEFINAIVFMREQVSEQLAVKCKAAYPRFKSLCDKKFVAEKSGYKFLYKNDLYKTVQPNTVFVEHYLPGIGTESMFERIDEKHDGSVNDAIPYSGNMRLELGKYYVQDGVVYKCTRDTGNPIYNALKDLVGIYVEEVK